MIEPPSFSFIKIALYRYWSATDGYEIDFSLCEPKVNSCDNSTSLFGRYISSSDQCYPLAKEYSGISLFSKFFDEKRGNSLKRKDAFRKRDIGIFQRICWLKERMEGV